MKKFTMQELTLNGILAALYAAITLCTASFAYGPIQFRIAEALCILPFFIPSTTVGLFLGCLAANLFSTVSALDIVIGSAATLIGCLWTSRLRSRWLVPLPTILTNTVLVGAMLSWVYTPDAFWQGFAVMGAEVALGEAAVMAVLGLPLMAYLRKSSLLEKLVPGEALRRPEEPF